MLRLATDADVNGDLVRGLRRALISIDLVRVQDVLPNGTSDPTVLAWVAAENRILITNDRATMVAYAYHRVSQGLSVTGLIATTNEQSIGKAIKDILLIAEYVSEQEMAAEVVVFLPFWWR